MVPISPTISICVCPIPLLFVADVMSGLEHSLYFISLLFKPRRLTDNAINVNFVNDLIS